MVARPLVPRIPRSRIAEVLAEDQTVAQAAAGALDTAILGRDILEGGDFVAEYNDDAVFAVVDADGKRTWLEIGPDGGPTERAAGLVADAVAPTVAETVSGDLGIADLNDTVNDLSFAVVDEEGRRTWLEADPEGKPTDRAIALIEAALSGVIDVGPATEYQDQDGAAHPVVPVAVACSGDSMTAGAGRTTTAGNVATTNAYPEELASLTGLTVANLGVGGETSRTIAGRAGGRPWVATVSGGEIPASGGVTVSLAADDGGGVAPLLQGSNSIPIIIAGVLGTLSYAASTYTFIRTTPGAAVTVARPEPIWTSWWTTYRNAVQVMWWGQNDADLGDGSALIAREQATVQEMTSLAKRWLVLGIPSGTDASRATVDTAMLRAFGARFLNVRKYLSSYASLDDVAITPTAQDNTDISAGSVPTSLRVDSVHLNAAGYALVARMVRTRMQQLEWI